ncbi:MAG: hypothetical protein AABW89_02510 [Nanoarchaeota archaeon]
MLGIKIFSKKKLLDKESDISTESAEDESVENATLQKSQDTDTKDATSILKLSTDVDKLKAAVEGFSEVRTSFTERMSSLNEQIGELRAMILDRDRTIRDLELKAVKAADLVETVQPEKFMIEIQKQDAHFEALKANLEGNESIMDHLMEELKELRKKLDFFRGVEEVVRLSEEVKKELIDIKKVESSIHVNGDKIEIIYSDIRKKQKELDSFSDSLQELNAGMQQHTKDIDSINLRIMNFADKGEVEQLTGKIERYMGSLKELNKTSSLSKDLSVLRQMLGNGSK